MPKKPKGVAKILIAVESEGRKDWLFSKKNAPGSKKHGRLELLGGGIEDTETPVEALIRELGEEEMRGLLTDKVEQLQPDYEKVIEIEGVPQYIFRISITLDEYLDIEHDEAESLGFKLVPQSIVGDKNLRSRLTNKTRLLLKYGLLEV